jgi:hypothetical protein
MRKVMSAGEMYRKGDVGVGRTALSVVLAVTPCAGKARTREARAVTGHNEG